MATTEIYTLWTKVIDPAHRYITRWQMCDEDLPKDKAIDREVKGNAYSSEHIIGLSYMALPKEVNPDLAELERLK